MEFHFDTRNHRTQEVRVGREDRDVVFRKAGLLVQNLVGTCEGIEYQMKLAAPWNGFRYQLRQSGNKMASASKSRRMHAFESDRPLIRHQLVEFELDIHGRVFRMTPQDRFGLTFVLTEGDRQCGRLALRDFEGQGKKQWEGDIEAPDDWSEPLAAFVAWLAREGRGAMS